MFIRKKGPKPSWLNRGMALIAAVNLGLVAFDLSYIPWRDSYLRHLPDFTHWYGERFKGIEPNRDTVAYLETVDALAVATDQAEGDRLLADLRRLSAEMVDQNPFAVANKTGTLERIKNQMHDRLDNDSAKAAFAEFWSRSYFDSVGEAEAIAFFDSELRPLFETNYFRGIGENGQPTDHFWHIDLPFVALFLTDYLIRTLAISRRYKGTNWFDAMLWRWYDMPLLIPAWRWLRIVPVTLRAQESRLVNLEPVRNRITRGLVASFAVELTEIVVLRLVEQVQDLVRNQDLVKQLLTPDPQRRYVDLNGVDEVEIIAQRLTHLTVYHVLPGIRSEIEALIRYSVTCVLEQSPVYRNLASVPGFQEIPKQMGDRLITDLTETAYNTLTTALEKPEGLQLTRQLISQLGETLRTEVGQSGTLDGFDHLVVDLLEELKVSYIRNLSERDLESLRQETHHRLYEMTQSNANANATAIHPQRMRDQRS